MKQVYVALLVLLGHQALAGSLPAKEGRNCEGWFCPEVYQPVCGSDGKTYSNGCIFGIAQCKKPSLTLEGQGECDTSATWRLGDLVQMKAASLQGKFNPEMFVKCEELGGNCIYEDQVNQCTGGMSTDNGGKCYFKEMVCCAPAMGTEE